MKINFEILPRISNTKSLPMGEIRSIQLGGNFINTPSSEPGRKEISEYVRKIKTTLLKKLLYDIPEITEEIENIIYATIHIKFKSKIKKLDAARKTLAMIDDQDIIFTDRKGRAYKGTDLREYQTADITKTSNGAYNWIETCMILRKCAEEYS